MVQGPGAALRSGAASRSLVERVFARHLTRPAIDVRAEELQLAIDGWRSKASAKRVAAGFRPIVRWAAKRGLMTKGEPLEAPTSRAQQRVLTRGEVGACSTPWIARVRGGRSVNVVHRHPEGEVSGATWREIKDGLWTIPSAPARTPGHMRSGRSRIMSSRFRQARALLEGLPLGEADVLVFAKEEGALVGLVLLVGANGAAARLRGDAARAAADLRHTGGDLGHPPHVISALLGHRDIGGDLHDGYNQSRYRPEVAAALQAVADLLDRLAAGEDNLVAIPRRA